MRAVKQGIGYGVAHVVLGVLLGYHTFHFNSLTQLILHGWKVFVWQVRIESVTPLVRLINRINRPYGEHEYTVTRYLELELIHTIIYWQDKAREGNRQP